MTNAGAAGAKRRVLLVEDDVIIRTAVRQHLTLTGFDVAEIDDGARALEVARATRFDAIVLDVMLPGIDGITICRRLRAEGANTGTPILMLTAQSSEADKILGLESGADDYVPKPVGIRELRARIDAILRRGARLEDPTRPPASRLEVRGLVLDLERREAIVRGRPVTLTKQEFDVLYLLAGQPGIVFSREALLAKVWGGETFVTDRTVDAVISRLRRKIERNVQNPAMILTAWGIGYKFVDAESARV